MGEIDFGEIGVIKENSITPRDLKVPKWDFVRKKADRPGKATLAGSGQGFFLEKLLLGTFKSLGVIEF